MRILHVVPTYLPATRYGGPIYSVHGLARAQAALGHSVSVATTSVDGPQDSPVPHGVAMPLDGVNVYYFRSRFLRRLYWAPSLQKFLRLKLKEFDFVHLHSVFLWPTNIAARECVHAGVPYALAPRGMLVSELIQARSGLIKRVWLALVERFTLRHAAFFHATSEREVTDAQALGVEVRSPVVVPNGIELTPALTPTAEPPYALYLGRINWKKQIDQLINAIALTPNLRLKIAGNDEENLLPALALQRDNLALQSRVDFLGEVTGAAKQALLANAQVLVLPSLSENFGNVVLEALHQRCPVIVRDSVGLATTVQSAGAGWVFSTLDELVAALQEVCTNQAERDRRGARGRALIEQRFAWPQVAAAMVAAYQRALPA
jgi:glycosyltransferase involved in cell wall biosynthesis